MVMLWCFYEIVWYLYGNVMVFFMKEYGIRMVMLWFFYGIFRLTSLRRDDTILLSRVQLIEALDRTDPIAERMTGQSPKVNL